MSRDAALADAAAYFDQGGFEKLLSDLVAIPSTSQEPAHRADVDRYLGATIQPWLKRLGFRVEIHPNPIEGFGPILTGFRIEDPKLPTILTYGHGDTVRGLAEQWDEGLSPWTLTKRGNLWYGRGTADNKGQHATVIAALETVLKARGELGFNVKLVLEMSEEMGSVGLREFVAAHAEELAADALIASDGPKMRPDVPTITTGSRGVFNFKLTMNERPGGVHSGNWGGMTTDPAIVLAHAIATITDRNGRIMVPEWLPVGGMPASVREALVGCEMQNEESATINPNWGEPGLTDAEKVYGWTSFIVLAMLSGKPDAPVNAVAPNAQAWCQLRYTVDADLTQFIPGLRRFLDANGYQNIAIEEGHMRMAASRTSPDNPWIKRAKASLERTLGKNVQIVPNGGGGLPGDVFIDHLHTPLVWIPLSYNGCKQHGPNEHVLATSAREGLLGYVGLWWDLGEAA
ncbi:MAG: M20/M25/M40 family metallo-hydrolase [Acetobacteraceae bacterium]|nr:M20/M25/M40 family metallo-hydrolase [Acetobacteraceae bacterium]